MATLKINRGTTYPMNYVYEVDGAASTLVGHTVYFTVKAAEYDSDATDTTGLITKDITDGTADGVAQWDLLPEETQLLAPGTDYYWDIKVKTNDTPARIYKTAEGKISVDGSPTNRGI